MTDGEKEKIKLRANYLNGVALIFMGLGGLGPLFAYVQNPGAWGWRGIVVLIVFFWAGGMSSWEIHRMAQRALNKLDQEQSQAIG